MTKKLDGYGVRVTLTTSALTFLETGVTPAGAELAGDPIEIAHNAKEDYVQQEPQKLKRLISGPSTIEYDPANTAAIIAALGVKQVIRAEFLEGDKEEFYGFMQSFKPSELKKGEEPSATVEFIPCGVDAAGAEEGITYTAAS